LLYSPANICLANGELPKRILHLLFAAQVMIAGAVVGPQSSHFADAAC
jgi:hypothetical protein